MTKLILAPNAFKESLSPLAAAAAMRKGASCANSRLSIVELPIADGGNGTVDALVHAIGGRKETARVSGPLGDKVEAIMGWFPEQTTAVIEVASACGIHLVPHHLRNPMTTQTVGVGELLLHAMERGAKRVLVGLGGSATNDGGIGFAHALGYRFLDQAGHTLPPVASSLARVGNIDPSGVDSRLNNLLIDIACDVANPLCGPNGASAVFGPQKGASSEMVVELDSALAHFATVIEKSLGVSVVNVPGAGAAGGLGAAMIAFAGGKLQSGIDLILDACRFDEHLRDADLCLTGEGSLDDSTIHGKALAGIARRCQKAGVPVIALVGQLKASPAILSQLGITAAFSICPGPVTLDEAKRHAEEWLAQTTEQVVRTVFSTRRT